MATALDLLVRADDQASRQLGRVTENLKKAGRAGEQHGRSIAKGSRVADKALKKTSASAKKAANSASALSGAAASLKASLLGLLGAAAILGFLRGVGAEFLQSERAIVRLNNSLKLTGEFTPLLSKKIQDLTRSLELQTGVSSDTLLNLFALARGFANSADQAEELLKASLDFSVGADIQVTESVRRLGRALKGQAADAANFEDKIRDLTKAELANGGATRLIQARFKGAAAELGKTLRGTIELSQKFGDLKVVIGEELTPSFDFWVESITRGVDALNKLAGVSKSNISIDEQTLVLLNKRLDAIRKEVSTGALATANDLKRSEALTKEEVRLRALIRATEDRIQATKAESDAAEDAANKAKNATTERTVEEKKGLQSLFDLFETLRAERLAAEGEDSEAARERIRLDLEARITAINQAFEVAGSKDTALRDITIANAESIATAQGAALELQQFQLSTLGVVSKGVTDQISSNFSSAFADAIVDGKSLEEGLKGVFDSILKTAIQTFIQIRLQSAFLAAFTPGGAGFFGGLLGFQHGTQRVPGPVGAPVPAILHGGETVTTAGGAAIAPAGGGGGGPLIGVLNIQVADLGPSERRKVIEALTEEIRAATDSGRVFASEASLASGRNEGRST